MNSAHENSGRCPSGASSRLSLPLALTSATRGLRRAPLGDAYSPTGLGKHIIGEASGEQPPVLHGPQMWVTEDGISFSRLAGFGVQSEHD